MRRARRGDGCTPHRDDWPTVSATRPELAHATPTPSPAHARSPSQLVTWALAVRSALVVVFEGKSEWGWGNLLPAVFAVHWMCMHAGRYCYVQVQDQELGSVLGYANGASWDAPLKQLKHEYGAFARIRRMDKPWLSRASWGNLTDQLRGHPAPLLLLHFRQQLGRGHAVPVLLRAGRVGRGRLRAVPSAARAAGDGGPDQLDQLRGPRCNTGNFFTGNP